MRYYFTGLLSLSLFFVACDNNSQTTPSKPEAGQKVALNIPISKTTLAESEEVYAYVYAIRETQDSSSAIDVLLSKNGKNFTGEFTVPDSTLAVYMYLLDKDKIDNNSGKGYGFPLYKDGKVIPNSELYLISTTRSNSYYWNDYGFTPGLLDDLKKTYSANQANYTTKDLLKYYSTYLNVRDKVDTAYELSLLNKITEASDLSSADAFKVKNYYKPLGDSTQYAVLNEKIKDYQPQSEGSSDLVWDLYSLPTAKEKITFFQKYLDTLKADPYSGGITQNLAYYTAFGLINEGKNEEALTYIKYFKDPGFTNSINSSVVNKLTDPAYKLNAGETALLNKLASETVKESDFKRQPTADFYKAKKAKQSEADYVNVSKAKILSKTGDVESALDAFKTVKNNAALEYYSYGSNYFRTLINNNKTQEAIDLWKDMKKKSFSDPEIDSILKVKIEGNAIEGLTWDAVQKSADESIKESSRKKIQEHFTTVAAPKFNLTDLDGNPVNFDDFKGKKLMVDFWATWCGPCIMSFPEMAQLQEHFATADTTVQFLFVLTLESGDKTELIASAKKLMESKNLPFKVLLDHPSSYVNQFQISAIPCKVFIDQTGNFRYKSTGYMRGYEKNLSDFETIFSLMDTK